MTTMEPHAATLAALVTAAELAVLLFLYRDTRSPFFAWMLGAWALRAAYFVLQLPAPLVAVPSFWTALAALAAAANSAAFLGSAVAYRRPRPPARRRAVIGAAAALVLIMLIRPSSAELIRVKLGGLEAAMLVGAGLGFWPRGRPHATGLGLLCASLLAWAVVRLGFSLPLPAEVQAGLLPAATLLQAVQMVGVIVVALTSAKQRLHNAERLAAIGHMASRVAHELRHPLSVMALRTDLATGELRPGGNLEAAGSHLAVVQSELRGVAERIEGYLRWGRLPALERERVDIDALVDGTLKAFATELRVQGITLRRIASPAVLALSADPEQLAQAIVNLIRNAIEAMPDGGELAVGTHADHDHIEVTIADTGAGVRPEDVERIFAPFETSKLHGTGLGLAVAREVVQEHGGSLVCRPAARGGRFVLRLPRAPQGVAR